MTSERRSYTLDSTLETVDKSEQAATEVATESGFSEDEILQIAMAVREAAVNAVYHGNAYDPNKKMTFAMERTPESIVITVSDEGKGLNE